MNKTFYCIFGTKNNCKNFENLKICHGNNQLKYQESAKYLGMKLDSQLTFSEHANYIRSKTFSKIKLLGKIRNTMDQSTSLMLYKTLILPIFDYGDVIYNCLSQKDATLLQRLQNMSLKTVLKVDKRSSTTAIHDQLNMLPLDKRRNMHSATQMFKISQNQVPISISNMFEKSSHENRMPTRRVTSGNYLLPHCRLELGKRNFRYRGTKIWEAIPSDIKNSANLNRFKKANEKFWRGNYPNGIT